MTIHAPSKVDILLHVCANVTQRREGLRAAKFAVAGMEY